MQYKRIISFEVLEYFKCKSFENIDIWEVGKKE